MRVRALALAGISAVLLTACGGHSSAAGSSSSTTLHGPDVAGYAADALERAGAVRVEGTTSTGGQEVSVDLHVQGSDAAGTMTMAGQTVQIVAIGATMYLQGPADLWAAQGVPESIASRLAGTWVALPAGADPGLAVLSLDGLVADLRHPTDGTIDDTVTTGELDGRPVLLVTQGTGNVLRVAADGTPYPLQISNKGAEAGTLTFSDFGVQQTITAPPSFVDLSELGA